MSGLENRAAQVPEANLWSPHSKSEAVKNGGAIEVLPSMIRCNAAGQIVMGWVPSQEDMFANDWVISTPPALKNYSPSPVIHSVHGKKVIKIGNVWHPSSLEKNFRSKDTQGRMNVLEFSDGEIWIQDISNASEEKEFLIIDIDGAYHLYNYLTCMLTRVRASDITLRWKNAIRVSECRIPAPGTPCFAGGTSEPLED